MILRFLFYAFLFYMLYKLIFDFIIPLYRTTRQVKRGFREMNERMRSAAGPFGPQETHPPRPQQPVSKKTEGGDYIDFEEIK